MATVSTFVISPSSLMSIIGLIHGPDKTIPTPAEDWHTATVDLVIPALQEQHHIVYCLDSIAKQSLKPQKIILYDDNSIDQTINYAKTYAESINLNLTVVTREKREGKTTSINVESHQSSADVLLVLDGDTALQSEDYIERLVQELYQGVGIASACGIILPFREDQRKAMLQKTYQLEEFALNHTEILYPQSNTRSARILQGMANAYREELYLFLQRYVYHAEMIFFGTIINPVGCAVAYRRKYIQNLFDEYTKLLGNDLTTSEDIFFGFCFADYGYRNVQVQDVFALTTEPRLDQLPRQIFKWSSSFFQSCYYFNSLMATPFKFITAYKKRKQDRKGGWEIRRAIKEQYRQAFGREYTEKYGRPIGWFIFMAALEKISFPTIMVIMIILKLWIPLIITVAVEILLFSSIIAILHRKRKTQNFFKSFLIAPIRYLTLFYDLFVIANFAKDIWLTKNREWKK